MKQHAERTGALMGVLTAGGAEGSGKCRAAIRAFPVRQLCLHLTAHPMESQCGWQLRALNSFIGEPRSAARHGAPPRSGQEYVDCQRVIASNANLAIGDHRLHELDRIALSACAVTAVEQFL
jgi:hypothetical protein